MDGPPYDEGGTGGFFLKANESTQVPGHYRSEFMHWDYVQAAGLDYLRGNATKYVSRWRKKNGLEDLKKALHYANKWLEINAAARETDFEKSTDGRIWWLVVQFAAVNRLTELEREAIFFLSGSISDVHKGVEIIISIMEEYDQLYDRPAPLEDSNKHAERYTPLELKAET